MAWPRASEAKRHSHGIRSRGIVVFSRFVASGWGCRDGVGVRFLDTTASLCTPIRRVEYRPVVRSVRVRLCTLTFHGSARLRRITPQHSARLCTLGLGDTEVDLLYSHAQVLCRKKNWCWWNFCLAALCAEKARKGLSVQKKKCARLRTLGRGDGAHLRTLTTQHCAHLRTLNPGLCARF